jgi:hypothetical protein
MNPYDHHEGHQICEAAFNHSSLGGIEVYFPMFTFCFHVQFTAKQHRTCGEYV